MKYVCSECKAQLQEVLDKHLEKRDPVSGVDAIFLKGWYSAVESIRKSLNEAKNR